MLIKVINFRRKTPRRPGDLRRLFRYLFTPKLVADTGSRLLGPPQLDHLVATDKPWGDHADEVIADLVAQFDFYVRESGVCQKICARPKVCGGLKACIGRGRPRNWYVHLIVSFAATDTAALRNPPDPHHTPQKWQSVAANTIRIARDAFDFLGWDGVQPAIFVAHGDREHLHVHAVIATAVFPDGYWNAFNFPRQRLDEIAAICADAFSLPTKSLKLQGYYRVFEGL